MGPAGRESPGGLALGVRRLTTWLRPDPALLTVRRAQVLLLLTLPGVIGAVVLWLLWGPLAGGAAGAGVALLTAFALRTARRQFHAWGYAEREDDLLVRRGLLVQRLSVIPYGRMQYVDVTAGPVERRLGLATVVMHTAAAATDALIPGLRAEEAERLRDRLAALGEARAAGV